MKFNTTAKEMQEEFKKEMPDIYPQRYQGYKVNSMNYNVVLSDIETYWNQEARFREGFSADDENRIVTVPNFFTKINGMTKDKTKYISFVKMLRDSSNTIVEKRLNMYNPSMTLLDSFKKDKAYNPKESYSFEKLDWRKTEGCVEPTVKNLIAGKIFCFDVSNNLNFEYLTTDKKQLVIDAMMKTLQENECYFKTMEDAYCFIANMLNMESNYINLLNNFDYGLAVPKVVVLSEEITKMGAMFLYALNEMGFDIVILSPNGKSNIERYIDINELSLGYFELDFDIIEKTKTDSEIKADKEKEKEKEEQAKKDKRRKIKEDLQVKFNALSAIAVLVIIAGLFMGWNGYLQTVIQCVAFFIVLFKIFDIDNSPRLYSKFTKTFTILSFIFVCLVIIVRLVIFIVDTSEEENARTYIISGFEVIDENIVECENGFVIHQKNDAIMYEASTSLSCYIENNATNTNTIRFEIWIGNTVVYRSSEIEPLSYVKNISLFATMPIGEHEMVVKYYDAKNYSKKTPENNNLLGSQVLTVHVVRDDDYDEKAKEYGY